MGQMRSDRIRRHAPQKPTNRSAVSLMHLNWSLKMILKNERLAYLNNIFFCSFREWHWSAKQPKSSQIGSTYQQTFFSLEVLEVGMVWTYTCYVNQRGRMRCTICSTLLLTFLIRKVCRNWCNLSVQFTLC